MVQGKVAASTQNQALSARLFCRPEGWMRGGPAVPSGISAVLHDGASLHSTAEGIWRGLGKYPERLD